MLESIINWIITNRFMIIMSLFIIMIAYCGYSLGGLVEDNIEY